MSITADILRQVDSITLGYTAKSYQAIMSAHAIELRLVLVLYVALYGIALFQGILPITMRDVARHLLKVFIVFQLATNWGTFTTFVYNVFTSGPDKVASALVGGSKPSEQLGEVFDQGMSTASDVYNKAGTLDISQCILGFLIMVGTLMMVGFALFLIILSKLGLAILLSLAPVFIPLSLWKSTKGIFHGWINYLVNYSMVPVVTYALLSLVLILMKSSMDTLKQVGETVRMYDVIPFLLASTIASLLFTQVNGIAASIGSGFALSTLGAFSKYINRPTKDFFKQLVDGKDQSKKNNNGDRKFTRSPYGRSKKSPSVNVQSSPV